MSALIRPAQADDIEPVCALLHEKMNRRIAPERWRRLMTYGWLEEKPDLGRVVEENGRILGYVGMVYADRTIAGRSERTCNICAWYLDKSLRGRGLGTAVMADATADPSLSYDIMTSSKNTLTILEEVGYRELDTHRWIWRRAGAPGPDIDIVDDRGEIRRRVDEGDRRLLDDHDGLPVTPMLVATAMAQTLLVFSIKRKGAEVTWYDLLHVGDRAMLATHGQALADALLPEGAAVLAADCRFVDGAPASAARERLPVPRFIKSSRLKDHELDHLYTELQLLDLKLD